MQVAILFAAFSYFEVSVNRAAELTFENSPPSQLEFIHHLRVRLFLCRAVGHEELLVGFSEFNANLYTIREGKLESSE